MFGKKGFVFFGVGLVLLFSEISLANSVNCWGVIQKGFDVQAAIPGTSPKLVDIDVDPAHKPLTVLESADFVAQVNRGSDARALIVLSIYSKSSKSLVGASGGISSAAILWASGTDRIVMNCQEVPAPPPAPVPAPAPPATTPTPDPTPAPAPTP